MDLSKYDMAYPGYSIMFGMSFRSACMTAEACK